MNELMFIFKPVLIALSLLLTVSIVVLIGIIIIAAIQNIKKLLKDK
ncbi:hypothetical protein [Senegalia massiliensis]|nr:hypothetical protein [Senegalia massiliensis]